MSSARERLLRKAEELARLRREQDALRRADEANRTRIEARVQRMAAECLTKAQAFVKVTGAPLRVWLSDKFGAEDTGFRLRAGTYCSLIARLTESGWDVTTHSGGGDARFAYASDEELRSAYESLLEPVVGGALEALLTGREQPLPERPPAPAAGFSLSRGGWPWRKPRRTP